MDKKFINTVYEMIVGIIAADGLLVADEVIEAERVGNIYLKEFILSDFRKYISNLDTAPNFFQCARSLNDLDDGIKMDIYRLLEAVAKGDAELADEEVFLLDKLASSDFWNLNL